MSGVVYQRADKPFGVVYDTSESGAWKLIATDGDSYDTAALLAAASKTAFPALNAGGFVQFWTLVSENGSNAAGSGFYVRYNTLTTPSGLAEAGTFWVPGGTVVSLPGNLSALWLYKGANGDRIYVSGAS